MKKLTFTIIICAALVFGVFAQTESQKLLQEINTLYKQGKIDDAIGKAEKVVKIEQKISETSESYADAITALANLQTEDLRIRAAIGIESPTTNREFEAKRRAAWFDENSKIADKTENLFRQALKIYNRTPENDNTQTATIKGQLAWVLSNFYGTKKIAVDDIRPRIDEEELLYLQAIASHEKFLGKNNSLTLRTYIEVADFYLRYVNFEKALPFYDLYQTEIEKKAGKDSKQLLKCLMPIARILAMSGRQTEADEVKQRVDKLLGRKDGIVPFNLTLRSKDLLAQMYAGKEIKKGKTVKVEILVDETGKITEAVAKTDNKSDKQKAETETLKLSVRPFIYNGEARKMRGYFFYILD